MAVGLLPRGRGLFLVRAGGHDCRVDVDRDQAAAGAGRGIAGQFPGPLPGRGPRGADGLQRPGRISGQAGDQPGDHRIGGCRPEELWLRPQHRHICQAVPAQRHGHRQVGDDLPWAVHSPWLAPPFQCSVQTTIQACCPQRVGQENPAALGDDSGAVGGHDDLRTTGGKLHAESAFRTGADRTLDKPYSSRSKALFVSKRSSSDPWPGESPRLASPRHHLMRTRARRARDPQPASTADVQPEPIRMAAAGLLMLLGIGGNKA